MDLKTLDDRVYDCQVAEGDSPGNLAVFFWSKQKVQGIPFY